MGALQAHPPQRSPRRRCRRRRSGRLVPMSCRARPVIGRATDPHVVPLFPPLPEVPGEAPVWRHRGSIERRTLAPEAVSAFLGH